MPLICDEASRNLAPSQPVETQLRPLMSCGRCNKLLQSLWLKTREMYSLTVLRSDVGNQLHWVGIRGQLPPGGLPASAGCRPALAYGLIPPISAHKVMSPSLLPMGGHGQTVSPSHPLKSYFAI